MGKLNVCNGMYIDYAIRWLEQTEGGVEGEGCKVYNLLVVFKGSDVSLNTSSVIFSTIHFVTKHN